MKYLFLTLFVFSAQNIWAESCDECNLPGASVAVTAENEINAQSLESADCPPRLVSHGMSEGAYKPSPYEAVGRMATLLQDPAILEQRGQGTTVEFKPKKKGFKTVSK